MLWLHEGTYRRYHSREYYHCNKIKVYLGLIYSCRMIIIDEKVFIVSRLLQHDKVLNKYFDEYKENTFDIFLIEKLRVFLKENNMNRLVSEKD